MALSSITKSILALRTPVEHTDRPAYEIRHRTSANVGARPVHEVIERTAGGERVVFASHSAALARIRLQEMEGR